MSGQKAMVGIISLTVLTAGCATTGTKAQETEGLKAQVASLESQIGDLSQRVEELSQHQEGAQTLSTGRANRSGKVTAVSLSTHDVQLALKAAGFYDGPIDGKLGLQTKRAIRGFQKAKGLTPDGKVGTKTAAALAKYLSAPDSKEKEQ